MEIQEYIDNRLNKQQEWFSKKSSKCKSRFRFYRTVAIVLAASIPFLSGFVDDTHQNMKYFVAFIGTLLAIIEGILALFKYQENWLSYRGMSEKLKREKFLYETKTKPYDTDKASRLIVTNVESILSTENAGWRDNMDDG